MIGDWTHREYPLLRPITHHYPVTVRDVKEAPVERRHEVVEEMATSTWSAWSIHHREIRTLLAGFLA
jgi:hypothetical protein